MADISYLTEIDYPNFSAGFSQSLKDIIDDINSNFEKLMAKPFLKGDDGKGVVYGDETVYDSTGNFTAFGRILIGVLFDIDDTSNINTLANLKTVEKIQSTKDGDPQTLITAVDKWPTSSALTIKCATVGNKKYIFPPYYFIDSRLNDLKVLTDDSKSDFEDFSCYVVGDYDGANWNLSKKQIMPTLYYDSDIDEFCWLVNGNKTGITAQGVKGDKGDSLNIWICEGSLIESNTKIQIDTIISPQDSEGTYSPDINIHNGDLVMVYFTNATDKQDATFGIAKERVEDYPYIEYESNNTLINIYSGLTLIDLLDGIGLGTNKARGLYIPYTLTVSSVDLPLMHILYADKDSGSSLYLKNVNQGQKSTTGNPSGNYNGNFILDKYNLTIKGQDTPQTNTLISGSNITSKNINLNSGKINFGAYTPTPSDISSINIKISGTDTIYYKNTTLNLSNSNDDYTFLSGVFIQDETAKNTSETPITVGETQSPVYINGRTYWTKCGNIINVKSIIGIYKIYSDTHTLLTSNELYNSVIVNNWAIPLPITKGGNGYFIQGPTIRNITLPGFTNVNIYIYGTSSPESNSVYNSVYNKGIININNGKLIISGTPVIGETNDAVSHITLDYSYSLVYYNPI